MAGFTDDLSAAGFETMCREYEGYIDSLPDDPGSWARALPACLFWALGFLCQSRALMIDRLMEQRQHMAGKIAAVITVRSCCKIEFQWANFVNLKPGGYANSYAWHARNALGPAAKFKALEKFMATERSR